MLQCSVILPFKPKIPIYFEVSKNGHPQVIQVTPFSYGKPWWRLGIGEKIGFWVVPTGAGAARQVGANQAERLASRSPSPWQPWDAWNHGPHGKNGKTSCLIKAHKSIPSGKHTKSYGKSPFVLKIVMENHKFSWVNHHFFMAKSTKAGWRVALAPGCCKSILSL